MSPSAPNTLSASSSKLVTARAIVSEVRARIRHGAWPAGSQLPTRAEIEAEFGASRVTVQRALDELRHDGWVTVSGRKGTYVARQLPHLTRYALVFHVPTPRFRPGGGGQFLETLLRVGRGWEDAVGAEVQPYFGVDGHEDSEDYQSLLRELRAQRLAGLIFATAPHALTGTPLLTEPGLPRVSIMTPGPGQLPPAVSLHSRIFWMRALDHFAQRGRTNIAFLTPPLAGMRSRFELEDLTVRGLVTHPYWCQQSSPAHPETATNAVHLLMKSGQSERPDALLISDDNLLPFAVAGLEAAGVKVGVDLDVVAHANFPDPPEFDPAICRLGFDIRQVISGCFDVLEAQRLHRVVPAVTEIGPLFATELAPEPRSPSL